MSFKPDKDKILSILSETDQSENYDDFSSSSSDSESENGVLPEQHKGAVRSIR